jgi:hypothetical protein
MEGRRGYRAILIIEIRGKKWVRIFGGYLLYPIFDIYLQELFDGMQSSRRKAKPSSSKRILAK